MKCPKCGYLGFERVDRCRNCGYDFSLTPTADVLELSLRADSDSQPLEDLSFLDSVMTSEPAATPVPPELPLFGSKIPGDLPLITRSSQPRPPLAVRRATPEVPRLRSGPGRAATLDLDLEPLTPPTAPRPAARSIDITATAADDADEDATIGARLLAVAADVLILLAIDVAVVYFTMQICGIGLEEFGILPLAPLLAFLLVQNGGYLVAFTAGGQTLGKMAAGIKVVSAEPSSPLDLGRAFVREMMWLVLAAPAGLGLLTALGRDHRGIHDRFAGTRVVRR